MKKSIILLSILVILTSLFVACNNQATTTAVTTIKTTMTEPGSGGFILKKVIKGDTVWGYSQEVYGTGIEWRQIVAENPFLSEPGRIYYDQARGKWIVIIKPGETIKIGGKYVSPTFTSEETTTITTKEPATGLPWWGWLLILGVAGFLIWLFWFRGVVNNNATSIVRIHIGRGGNIDQSTRAAVVAAEIERSYQFREHVATEMLRNPNLSGAHLSESSNQTERFTLSTEYRTGS